jgi:hypothetical protein
MVYIHKIENIIVTGETDQRVSPHTSRVNNFDLGGTIDSDGVPRGKQKCRMYG